ncbi:DUF3052 domain-containing protein [Neobacillus sp. D3-1R]|uniref:DUF3052 domain-containing protein n=1 Tax=Neobacillus sp. D3-1R TaxID=3445778 RepID=UPI003F9FB84E
MSEAQAILKKLNYKDNGQSVLVINAPNSYNKVLEVFIGEVHKEIRDESYDFIQVFGTNNVELKELALGVSTLISDDGLLWLCYPKKSSKAYKDSDCSRETVMGMLADQGYEPVRMVAIDEDWSALRFRKPENIKSMKRKFAVTEAGKQRAE